MTPGQRLEAVAELLLSNQGSLVLGIAALLAVAAPFADRYLIRRKRLYYRVQYNSKLGLSPVDLQDRDDSVKHADPELQPIAELLDRMSIVVIRVRNTGIDDISAADLKDDPIEFTFGGRVIWNARISEPSIETHRKKLKDGLEFFTADTGDSGHGDNTLDNVRVSLGRRLSAWLRGEPVDRATQPSAGQPAPQWHGVRFRDISLQRKEKFKLVVVLREPDGNTDGELTKEVRCFGHVAGGRIVDERRQRRITWPRLTATFGVLLTGALLATLLVNASQPGVATDIACADGRLRVVGSSAFIPVVERIATEYTRTCSGAEIDTEATGSIGGVRMLAAAQDGQDELAALSDGESGAATPELVAQPLAVIVYTVVVNDSVGVDSLTVEQIRGIHDGRYRDWKQLRDGPSLPIRIVGRGQESGSRQTFEATVLGTTEPGLSSDSCASADRDSGSPLIRCERSTEAQVVAEVADTAGAIGYVDLPSAIEARTDGQPLTVLRLGEVYPDANNIEHGYPFWAIEYLYTRGAPENGSVLRGFIGYLRSGTARAELREAGYTPCIGGNGVPHRLCRG
ncbi:ABC-type phosphate transport system, periplasmic component [Saccharomonospora marina XMU15]|uniref:ABC-type phosphate transport system, periplasmic component n=1 Tax=Saccharomonospora marina XMU15 TaxID=882083 RepID=H5WZZ4_9PSEU|nr:substrate-binding domain-containing protein [Saccharomonospora marina]EHR52990.1 ABC-type phosphate transport system, periplasmic component [Saccharomonospora marina XMU15]